MRYKLILTALAIILLFPTKAVKAAENEAYTAFYTARKATHAAGPFRLRGDETTKIGDNAAKIYTIIGYDYSAAETYMQFTPQGKDATTSFLITTSTIYTKGNTEAWEERDLLELLPQFINLGTFDQFIALELLNSDRLALYQDFMSVAPSRNLDGINYDVLQVKIGREEYKQLIELLTEDVKSLLGPAAESLSDSQLALIKTFAKGILTGLDAEMIFMVYVNPETGLISRFNTQMDMANPYGQLEQDSASRIKTSARLQFYDFGENITKVVVE